MGTVPLGTVPWSLDSGAERGVCYDRTHRPHLGVGANEIDPPKRKYLKEAPRRLAIRENTVPTFSFSRLGGQIKECVCLLSTAALQPQRRKGRKGKKQQEDKGYKYMICCASAFSFYKPVFRCCCFSFASFAPLRPVTPVVPCPSAVSASRSARRDRRRGRRGRRCTCRQWRRAPGRVRAVDRCRAGACPGPRPRAT